MITTVQNEDSIPAEELPNLEQLQIIDQNYNQAEINRAVQQSLDQHQTTKLSRKNGLKKRYFKQIKKMKVGKTNQTCTICIELFKKDEIINLLPCGHIIHLTCCKQWTTFNEKCPVCRFNLTEHFEFLQLSSLEPKNQQKQEEFPEEPSL